MLKQKYSPKLWRKLTKLYSMTIISSEIKLNTIFQKSFTMSMDTENDCRNKWCNPTVKFHVTVRNPDLILSQAAGNPACIFGIYPWTDTWTIWAQSLPCCTPPSSRGPLRKKPWKRLSFFLYTFLARYSYFNNFFKLILKLIYLINITILDLGIRFKWDSTELEGRESKIYKLHFYLKLKNTKTLG